MVKPLHLHGPTPLGGELKPSRRLNRPQPKPLPPQPDFAEDRLQLSERLTPHLPNNLISFPSPNLPALSIQNQQNKA